MEEALEWVRLDLWLPILMSGVAVFILSFLVWTALPHHKSDFKKLPDEDGTISAMRGRPPEPCAYMFPHAWTHAEVQNPEIAQKLTQGPVGFITIVPSGIPTVGKIGKKFGQISVFYLVWCLISLVAIEGTEAPLWQGGTTRRSRSYGKEFQRRPERMHAAPNRSRTSETPH